MQQWSAEFIPPAPIWSSEFILAQPSGHCLPKRRCQGEKRTCGRKLCYRQAYSPQQIEKRGILEKKNQAQTQKSGLGRWIFDESAGLFIFRWLPQKKIRCDPIFSGCCPSEPSRFRLWWPLLLSFRQLACIFQHDEDDPFQLAVHAAEILSGPSLQCSVQVVLYPQDEFLLGHFLLKGKVRGPTECRATELVQNQ